MFLIFLCRVLKMIKAISVIVMLAMAPTVALAQASAPVKGSLKGVCYNMMTGEYTDGPCGTAGTSKVMTPDKIKEAGDLLRRRDALATMLAAKHQVYHSITSLGGLGSTLVTIQNACMNISGTGDKSKLPPECQTPDRDYRVPCGDWDTEKRCVASLPTPPRAPEPPPVYEIDSVTISPPLCEGAKNIIYSTYPPSSCAGPAPLVLDAKDTTDVLTMLIAHIDDRLLAIGVAPPGDRK